MKTKPAIDPAAAFPAPASAHPTEPELWTALGPAADPLRSVVTNLRAAQPAVTSAWQYSERSGWYQIHLLKKRRLLYLVPKHEDFRVSLILGRKAIEELKQGPFARQTAALLRTAKHYPEGTALSFDRHSLAPDLLCALLDAKLAH
jgi:hypothetical protein